MIRAALNIFALAYNCIGSDIPVFRKRNAASGNGASAQHRKLSHRLLAGDDLLRGRGRVSSAANNSGTIPAADQLRQRQDAAL
jgi:hypothetical protein